MNKFHFETFETKLPRPEGVPSSWTILNAFRPIAGTLKEAGGGTTWEQPGGPQGRHWAALDPNDPMKGTWDRVNHRDGAVIVSFEGDEK